MTYSTLQQIKPQLVLNNYAIMNPVADLDALALVDTAITQAGDLINVVDAGEGTPAIYSFDGDDWVLAAGPNPEQTPTAVTGGTNWTSHATTILTSPTTGYMTGYFTSTAGSNTNAIGTLVAGFKFTGKRTCVKSVSSVVTPDVLSSSGTAISVPGVTFGSGDIVYVEFEFVITG